MELTGLPNLVRLDLSNNPLGGEILPELGALTNLEGLGLAGNDLTGGIPVELTGMSELPDGSITSSGNRLSGALLPDLAGLTKLHRTCIFRTTDLSGGIASRFGALPKLMELDLSGNSLTSEIPSRLGRAVELTKLDLSDNNLSGRILPELGSLTKLEYLYQGNNLQSLDTHMRLELTMLKELRLGGGNAILGCIAEELREVADSDLDGLYLRYCGTTVLPATGQALPLRRG